MRHNNARRPRNNVGGRPQQQSHNPNQKKNTPSRMRVFDSNGPDVRIRGTAWQVTEKYMALAKDAESAGDFIMAESYHQHAEHYQRIINSFVDETPVMNDRHVSEAKTGDEEDLSLPASIVGTKAPEKEMVAA